MTEHVVTPDGYWILEEGIWAKTENKQAHGIVISDSVVMGDVIQNIILNDPEYVANAVKQTLANLGFNGGAHPSSLNNSNKIQIDHTLTLADTIANQGINLDGWTEISLGYACELEDDLQIWARIHFEKALKFGKEHQDLRLQLHAELGIAILELKSGKLNIAERACKRIQLEFKKSNDDVGLSNAEEILGLIAYSRGDYNLSKSLHENALELRKEIGYEDGVVTSIVNLGNVAMSQGKINQASDLFSDVNLEDQSERDEAQLLCSRGVNEMQKANIPKALNLINKSLEIRNKINDKTGQAECYNYLGTAYMMQGNFHKGRDVCRKALKIADSLSDNGAKAHALYHMGQASIGMGDMNSGVDEIKRARGLFSKCGDRAGVSNCNSMLRKLEIYDVEMLLEPKVLVSIGVIVFLIILMI
jgi:tetratricopeptide (TPR) repeat protein